MLTAMLMAMLRLLSKHCFWQYLFRSINNTFAGSKELPHHASVSGTTTDGFWLA